MSLHGAARALLRAARSSSALSSPSGRAFAASSQTRFSSGLPKVRDQVVELTAIDRNGERHKIKGLIGQSLLTALIRCELEQRSRHVLEEIGSCNGNCEVTIANEWLEKIPPPTPDEVDKLKSVSTTGVVNKHSRLGCQVKLSKDLEGMTVAQVEDRPYYTL